MLHSAEIRWFIPGQLPDEVRDWFSAGRSLTPESSRGDRYLVFPGCDTVGVKLREGKLEIKPRTTSPRSVSPVSGVSGLADAWVKWSFGSDGLRTLKPELLQSGLWVEVRKERTIRKFSADSGSVLEVQPEQKPLPNAGCNVELTAIEIDARRPNWYSLGFEAFGEQKKVESILDETVRLFFGAQPPLPEMSLGEKESLSYPGWLAQLVASGDVGSSA
jgi:hypothetical protein